MELFARPIIFFLFILFVSSGFRACRAEDCGGQKVANTIVVDQSGAGNFRTVQAAIDSVPENNNGWVKIHINPGIYTEKVHIPLEKPCIILEGEGRELTSITYRDRQQTDQSATFISSPNNVIAKGITFKVYKYDESRGINLHIITGFVTVSTYLLVSEDRMWEQNSFNLLDALDMDHWTLGGSTVTQAVAATIYGDKSAFFDCGFEGFQDTLWDALGRHYFKNCYIQGAIDFIFGTGQSYYEDCLLNVTSSGFVTAQGRSSVNDPSGFVFIRGSIVGSGTGNGEVFLGRAYGPYSRVIFHGTYLGAVVNPQGWNSWHYGGQESKLTYTEVRCRGPGANTTDRVRWEKKLVGSELKLFSKAYFINQDGWLDKLPI